MRSLLSQKRGQASLDMIVPAIITLGVAAIFLIFTLIILTDLADETVTETTTTTNETLTTMDENGENVAHYLDCGFSMHTASVELVNASTADLVPATNYTAYSNGTVIYVSDGGAFNNSNWNITYSWDYGLEACLAVNETIAGQGKFADYFDLIVLAVIITIVLSLIMVIVTVSKIR